MASIESQLLKLKGSLLKDYYEELRDGSAVGGSRASSIVDVSGSEALLHQAWDSQPDSVLSFFNQISNYIVSFRSDEENKEQAKCELVLVVVALSVSLRASAVVHIVSESILNTLRSSISTLSPALTSTLISGAADLANLENDKVYKDVVTEFIFLYSKSCHDYILLGSTEQSENYRLKTVYEVIPSTFLLISHCVHEKEKRLILLTKVLFLVSDLGQAAETLNPRQGSKAIGPLLPVLAELLKGFKLSEVTSAAPLLLLANLWYYVAAFQLVPSLSPSPTFFEGYPWHPTWAESINIIAQITPPLTVSHPAWLAEESQVRDLCSTPLSEIGPASDVHTWKKSSIFLLAVASLEVVRVKGQEKLPATSVLQNMFAYLIQSDFSMSSPVQDYLVALSGYCFTVSLTAGNVDQVPEVALLHAEYLIPYIAHPQDHVRNLALSLLKQLQNKHPQVFLHLECLYALLAVLENAKGVSELLYKAAVDATSNWITNALNTAPITFRGLVQEVVRNPSVGLPDFLALLSGIPSWDLSTPRLSNCWAVRSAASSVSGLGLDGEKGLDFLAVCTPSAALKAKITGEVEGMKRLVDDLNSEDHSKSSTVSVEAILVSRLERHMTSCMESSQGQTDKFRESCLQGAALLVISNGQQTVQHMKLLELLCWTPVMASTKEAMETGIFVWSWLLSAQPSVADSLFSHLIQAWLWTIESRKGIFSVNTVPRPGTASSLSTPLSPADASSEKDLVSHINAHSLWLGFMIDCFLAGGGSNVPRARLFACLLNKSFQHPELICSHPAAATSVFTLISLGLHCVNHIKGKLLHDLQSKLYRAGLIWFSNGSAWWESAEMVESETEILQMLIEEDPSTDHHLKGARSKSKGKKVSVNELKSLFLLLCKRQLDRLDTWTHPLLDSQSLRVKVTSTNWKHTVTVASSVSASLAVALLSFFPFSQGLREELSALVQAQPHLFYTVPDAASLLLPADREVPSPASLSHLVYWSGSSVFHALSLLTPQWQRVPQVASFALSVLQSFSPETVTPFLPQLVQALRYDSHGLVEQYLVDEAHRSQLFAHKLIWQLQGEEAPEEGTATEEEVHESELWTIVPRLRARIIDGFSPEEREFFDQEFHFFDQVTSISGTLKPIPKEKRRAAIPSELQKIRVPSGRKVYLPTDPHLIVQSIDVRSGIPLQSAKKVPIMVTFQVVPQDQPQAAPRPQACIFKVGDDCRQDVLALQVISLLQSINQRAGLELYLFPYGVLPTGFERGIIQVVPNARSRNQIGEITDAGLHHLFVQEYGPEGSLSFKKAQSNFIVSCAGYAVASLLLQPKDRHNGNLLIDRDGRLVHIDFGFILETSPGGNMRFESAQFKLSHDMSQILDPSGRMESEEWHRFVSLCVKGYLAARQHMDAIVSVVLAMLESGLPCFSRGDPIGNLKKRFHLEMNDREAANFMINTCMDAYNKWTTAGYDLIQYLQQGIEK